MAQLDKFIDKLLPGQEIILEAGKPPVLKGEGGSAPMLSQQLSAAQIAGLAQELAPAELRELVAQHKPARFDYISGGKTVTVVCAPESEQLTVKISAGTRRSDATAAGPEPEVNALLRKMFKLGASDLHLTSGHFRASLC